MTVEDIRDFIRGVGLRPVLRDTVYNEIETVS
jgi:2-iminoacetate synthase ThiH